MSKDDRAVEPNEALAVVGAAAAEEADDADPAACTLCGGPVRICGGTRRGPLLPFERRWVTAIRLVYAGLCLTPTAAALWGGALRARRGGTHAPHANAESDVIPRSAAERTVPLFGAVLPACEGVRRLRSSGRILLLHLDGKLPNVALMRVAAHHRALGDHVVLRHAPTLASVEPELGDNFDRVYASAIFERTRPVAERLLEVRPDAVVGGTGWDLRRTLEDIGVVTKAQDYSIYPRFQPSIGFTQRGCRLRCEFCVVPKKEGAAREEQSIADLWRGEPYPRQILLLDNDFFGVRAWRARVDELRAGGFRVCFAQGINARMISVEVAKAVASLDYRDDGFKVKRIYTAWDNREDEATLFRGLDRLAVAGVKPDHVMVYCLIGYWPGETHADRDYRRRRLRAWGARPYPMPFTRTPELVGFARWCLGAYDKTIPWEEWTRAHYQPRALGDRTGAQLGLPWDHPVGDGSSAA